MERYSSSGAQGRLWLRRPEERRRYLLHECRAATALHDTRRLRVLIVD